MAKFEAPSFDGKARNYKSSKAKFEEMVAADYESQAQLQYLEKALTEEVKQKLSTVMKTPCQDWTQLETLYGDPRIIVKEAMGWLHKVTHNKKGKDFMIIFATTLEDTEALL